MEHEGTEGNEMVSTRLNEREIKAIEMKATGYSYEEMARETGYSPSYLRKLFMEGGRLRPAYDQHIAGVKVIHDTVTQERLKTEAAEAFHRMVEWGKDLGNEGRAYKATEFILEMAGTSPEATMTNIFRRMGKEATREQIPKSYLEAFGEWFFNPVAINIITHKDSPKAQDGQSEETPQS